MDLIWHGSFARKRLDTDYCAYLIHTHLCDGDAGDSVGEYLPPFPFAYPSVNTSVVLLFSVESQAICPGRSMQHPLPVFGQPCY